MRFNKPAPTDDGAGSSRRESIGGNADHTRRANGYLVKIAGAENYSPHSAAIHSTVGPLQPA